ncbi:hypothetical protein NDU88_006565 [Pleurodeles waltl]|uniref:Uncharacterized protein n=1 Tax=Pleurodeles waltl TaxID=8319 RepID=A0AAV7LPK3_PLEWA|nr:hypothetical protein NDU88_006565 [Pleurodeles waltl]
MPGPLRLYWGCPPPSSARSLASAPRPGALSRPATQQQVVPTQQASRLCLAPRGANKHRPPPPAGHQRRAKCTSPLKRGPDPQGGSPPRARQPAGNNVAAMRARGCRRGRGPTRWPLLQERRIPQDRSSCPGPKKQPGAPCSRACWRGKAHAPSQALPRSRAFPPGRQTPRPAL